MNRQCWNYDNLLWSLLMFQFWLDGQHGVMLATPLALSVAG